MAGMPAVPVSSCWLALYGVAAIALITLSSIVYNLFFHPLRSYPGPWYAKASIVWFFYRTILGNYTHAVHQLHLKYGAVVRIAPNELACTDPQAWKDIYGHRNGMPENVKDPSQIISEDPAHPTIIDATREHHSKIRRLISNGFSDKSMRQQENILVSYVKLFIEGLRKNSPGPVDLVEWYNVSQTSSIRMV
jgi:cytochrome P450